MEKYKNIITEYVVEYTPKLLGALAVLVAGWILIGWIMKVLRQFLAKKNLDPTLQKFLVDLANWSLKILLIVSVISQLGIATTSFAAIIGAAGLAIGLALQGSLSNFAGGVLIMIFKPFKVGDLIEAQGVLGTVKEIQIFTTKLVSPENKLIIIPNGILSNGNIINYSAEGKIRVDLVIGVSYDSDIKQVKELLMRVVRSHPKVLQDPPPTVAVLELAESSVNFAVRPWTKPEYYWDVYFDLLEQIKLALDKAGIEIPYPHSVEIVKEWKGGKN